CDKSEQAPGREQDEADHAEGHYVPGPDPERVADEGDLSEELRVDILHGVGPALVDPEWSGRDQNRAEPDRGEQADAGPDCLGGSREETLGPHSSSSCSPGASTRIVPPGASLAAAAAKAP